MAQNAERRQIVMNYSSPPGADDMLALALAVIDVMPLELAPFSEDLTCLIEDFPDNVLMQELDIESEFDLLALYSGGAESVRGIVRKSERAGPQLTLYRRPILDLWCDTGEDLQVLIRNIVISEVAQSNGFSDEEIEMMCAAASAIAL